MCRVYFSAFNATPLVSVFMPHSFDYYSFIIQFEIRKNDASRFVLSQGCFGYIFSIQKAAFFTLDPERVKESGNVCPEMILGDRAVCCLGVPRFSGTQKN